jgi:hypothetical protein
VNGTERGQRLGTHRAYFASEEQNRLEKFRPYRLPAQDWLEWVCAQFKRRTVASGGQEVQNAPGSSSSLALW